MILDKFKNKKKDKSLTPSEGYKNYLKNRENKNLYNANCAFNLYFRYLGNTS